ncbi:MAG: TonB family protein [Myxococcales bacterium]|nr:TonB family protein [Myxococcales bacterium]
MREFEIHNGTRVAEVVATYGGTVLDVQHVGQIRSQRSQAPRWLGLGGALLIGGLGLFGHEVAQDWEGYQEARISAQASGDVAPQQPGTGLGGLGVALALLGLVPFGLGVARYGDHAPRAYTIGEGHGASFHVPPADLPTPAAFPLVDGSGDEFVLGFTRGMEGELVVDGEAISLAALASSGRAIADGPRYSVALPPGASARLAHQDVTFHVRSVAPGAAPSRRGVADRPFWAYNAGSLAAIGSLLALSQLTPAAAHDLSMDELAEQSRFVGYLSQPDRADDPDAPTTEATKASDDQAGGTGMRSRGEEGAMGKPDTRARGGRAGVRGPKDAIPSLDRNFDPEMRARTSGILGVLGQGHGHFLASPDGAFALGNDDADTWGSLTGTAIGEAYGVGGIGLIGTGRGGGGTGEGTLGIGGVGLIGRGGGGGGGTGYGRGNGTGFEGRGGTRAPQVRQAIAEIQGALDKDIIRRIVRAHINEVRHCYNQGLAKDPSLKGRVAVQFSIGGAGQVISAAVADSSLKDPGVSRCIAQAVRRWKFPKPQGGGSVIVTYPFVLEPG